MIVPLNEKFKICGVDVTFIDANHCPGSVMILFEPPNGEVICSNAVILYFLSEFIVCRRHIWSSSDGLTFRMVSLRCQAVLHTGDFRFCSAMRDNASLQSTSVHTLILDTTYCDQQVWVWYGETTLAWCFTCNQTFGVYRKCVPNASGINNPMTRVLTPVVGIRFVLNMTKVWMRWPTVEEKGSCLVGFIRSGWNILQKWLWTLARFFSNRALTHYTLLSSTTSPNRRPLYSLSLKQSRQSYSIPKPCFSSAPILSVRIFVPYNIDLHNVIFVETKFTYPCGNCRERKSVFGGGESITEEDLRGCC